MKKIIVAVCSLALFVIAFGIYSTAVTFQNWPWTTRSNVTGQQFAGFVAGHSKADIFEYAIGAEDAGVIRVMLPKNRSSGPAGQNLRGTDLTVDLLDRFTPYDEWVVGLNEPDKSLNLYFVEDKLDKVLLLTYRGPKE